MECGQWMNVVIGSLGHWVILVIVGSLCVLCVLCGKKTCGKTHVVNKSTAPEPKNHLRIPQLSRAGL